MNCHDVKAPGASVSGAFICGAFRSRPGALAAALARWTALDASPATLVRLRLHPGKADRGKTDYLAVWAAAGTIAAGPPGFE